MLIMKMLQPGSIDHFHCDLKTYNKMSKDKHKQRLSACLSFLTKKKTISRTI